MRTSTIIILVSILFLGACTGSLRTESQSGVVGPILRDGGKVDLGLFRSLLGRCIGLHQIHFDFDPRRRAQQLSEKGWRMVGYLGSEIAADPRVTVGVDFEDPAKDPKELPDGLISYTLDGYHERISCDFRKTDGRPILVSYIRGTLGKDSGFQRKLADVPSIWDLYSVEEVDAMEVKFPSQVFVLTGALDLRSTETPVQRPE